jgi:hypothetical protein
MSDQFRSLLLVPAGLYILLGVALVLILVRPPRPVDLDGRTKLVGAFLIGIAAQCAHTVEEFVTGLHRVLPPLFNLAPLSDGAFVGFNLFWLGVWALAALGALRGYRLAYFPIWFFGLAMCLNGVAHPLLAVWVGDYFPGLITSPLVGIMGVVVTRRLFQYTAIQPSSAGES